MPPIDSNKSDPLKAPDRFHTTHWSVVAAAAKTQSPDALAALETLSTTYWYPLYAYLRKKGLSSHEAEDLTQEFFARRVVTKLIFKRVDCGQGKFRTWLLNSMQNLLRNEWDRQKAKKRGGDRPHVPLDATDAESRYLNEPGHDLTPERIYDRTWAMTLIEGALEELRRKYERAGKTEFFNKLKGFLPGALDIRPHGQVAVQLGKSEKAVKMAVSRLRKEYGRVLRDEIYRTVANEDQVKEELRDLFAALDV